MILRVFVVLRFSRGLPLVSGAAAAVAAAGAAAVVVLGAVSSSAATLTAAIISLRDIFGILSSIAQTSSLAAMPLLSSFAHE